jgi:NTP pyrophosphatase (non-canonical NTP hydrolase)
MSEESYPTGWVKATLMINPKTNEIHAIGGDREEGEGDTKYIGFEIIKKLIKGYSFRDYQIETRVTDKGTGKKHGIDPSWLYYVLGIAGETGELVEKIKKLFRDDYGVMTVQKLGEIEKEMGDCLWYHARLADTLGLDFGEVAKENMRKLLDRKARNKIHGEGDDR